ncbi:hypothetical protein JW905_09900 [bacterium]|nr:hypothetical protein [candidate division CSSED10-310 bacterium]
MPESNETKPAQTLHPEDRHAIVRQVIQNLVIGSPLVFAKRLADPAAIAAVLLAFLMVTWLSILIVLSSSFIRQRFAGRPHGLDRLARRPAALLVAAMVASLATAAFWNGPFGLLCLLYVLLGMLHDLVLVRLVLLDVIFLAVEFTLRAVLGAAIIQVHISPWLMLCTFMAALIVSLGKRRNEITTADGDFPREVLEEYSPKLIDQMLAVVTSSAYIGYALYTISEHAVKDFGTTYLIFTQPMVLYGILRYLYLTHQGNLKRGSEVTILSDPPMVLNLVLWLLTVITVIYIL